MLECRDPPLLKLRKLKRRPASVAASSTDSGVDSVALDTATSDPSCDSDGSGRTRPFAASSSLFGIEKDIRLGGALPGVGRPVSWLRVK